MCSSQSLAILWPRKPRRRSLSRLHLARRSPGERGAVWQAFSVVATPLNRKLSSLDQLVTSRWMMMKMTRASTESHSTHYPTSCVLSMHLCSVNNLPHLCCGCCVALPRRMKCAKFSVAARYTRVKYCYHFCAFRFAI